MEKNIYLPRDSIIISSGIGNTRHTGLAGNKCLSLKAGCLFGKYFYE
jgi:hypothetical protein